MPVKIGDVVSDADPLGYKAKKVRFAGDRWATAVLTVVIWMLAAVAFAMAFTFNSRARVLPILFVGVLLVLASVELLAQWRRRGEYGDSSGVAIFGESAGEQRMVSPDRIELSSSPLAERVERDEGLGEWLSIAIAMSSFTAVLLLGFRYGAPVFVLFFTRLYGKKSWLSSSAIAVGVYLILYQLFGGVFGVRLYPGILG